MNILVNDEIEYPLTVFVKRPKMSFDENGNFEESFETVITPASVTRPAAIKQSCIFSGVMSSALRRRWNGGI